MFKDSVPSCGSVLDSCGTFGRWCPAGGSGLRLRVITRPPFLSFPFSGLLGYERQQPHTPSSQIPATEWILLSSCEPKPFLHYVTLARYWVPAMRKVTNQADGFPRARDSRCKAEVKALQNAVFVVTRTHF